MTKRKTEKKVPCNCGSKAVCYISQHVLVTAISYCCQKCDRLIWVQAHKNELAFEMADAAWAELQRRDRDVKEMP